MATQVPIELPPLAGLLHKRDRCVTFFVLRFSPSLLILHSARIHRSQGGIPYTLL